MAPSSKAKRRSRSLPNLGLPQAHPLPSATTKKRQLPHAGSSFSSSEREAGHTAGMLHERARGTACNTAIASPHASAASSSASPATGRD
jgi:hypothetical protein